MGFSCIRNTTDHYSTVANNIFAQHTSADIGINGSADDPVLTRFYHNTVDGAPYGIYVDQYSEVQILNSIISHHGTGISEGVGTDNLITVDDTLFHGNITADTEGDYGGPYSSGDPYYVDAGGGDYHIRANSAACDIGMDVGYSYDFENDPRPMPDVPGGNPYDAGADEFWWKIMLPVIQKE